MENQPKKPISLKIRSNVRAGLQQELKDIQQIQQLQQMFKPIQQEIKP